MSGSGSNQEASLPSNPFINNNSATITSPDVIRLRRWVIQNYSILWLDECMDETSKDYENSLTQIRTIADNVTVFKQRDECIDFLTDGQEDIKSYLVVENSMAQQIIPLINDIPQLDSVHVFGNIKSLSEEPTKKWQKIKRVHTNTDDLCQALQFGIKQYHQDSIAMSFITANEMASTDNLNQLEPTFMYTQIFKDILLDMEHGKQAIKHFTAYCRNNNSVSPTNIDRFEKEYHAQSAIWWYTFPSNIYSMLNYALRSMEGDTIINMGFFINDLHQQILELYHKQVNSDHGKSFIVYRGQGLSKANFEELKKTEAGLLSFNNFLSTSTEQDVALGLAYSASENVDMVGILFVMSVDPNVKSAPFASIKELSYFREEDEILFSMHTVFRVSAIKQMDDNNQLYQVELQLTSDDDQQLRLLTDRIRTEAGGTGWHRLGNLLLKIGQFNKAEELCSVLLQQTSDESEKALYYGSLGCVKIGQGDYEKAIWYYEQGLKTYQKTIRSYHPYLATSYNNIGAVYDMMGDYSKALSSLEKALEIRQKTLPSNHSDLATTYNSIGLVYKNMGEYSKATSFYEKALEMYQKTLPSNHPDLATSYNNISAVYDMMGNYSKALSSLEKALEIKQKTLPSNHPSLATSYNNIDLVYKNMGEYLKALSFYENALKMYQETLPLNHPLLANSYSNIGFIYSKMGEYSKALSSHEKALDIRQKTLPSNHPSLATSYNNIGFVYGKVREYLKALSFYEKALKMYQKTLPTNHHHMATSYNNIAAVYTQMGEYPQALSFYEKSIEIHQKTLPSNHPSLSISYDNIGFMYNSMRQYSKALLSLEKALEIKQKTLPSNHPDLATSYNNIGALYDMMGDYSKALSFYEKALKIYEETLPSNHPDLASSFNNIGNLCNMIREYPKALSFYERALETIQKTLPTNYPYLAISYNNIANVYDKMGEYSKALSYFERALDIFQRKLSPTHSDIKTVKNNIENLKKKL